jgi:hypothetical protein
MIYDLFFFVLPLRFLDDNTIFADFQEAAFGFATILERKLYLTANVFSILAMQFQRLVEAGRGYLEGEVAIWEKGHVFQLFIKSPVNLDAFLDRNAIIAVKEYFDIIGGFDPHFHQKITGFPRQYFLDKPLYYIHRFLHWIKLKKGTLPFPSTESFPRQR